MEKELIIELRKHYGVDNHLLSDKEILIYYRDTLIFDTTRLSVVFSKFTNELKKAIYSYKIFNKVVKQ